MNKRQSYTWLTGRCSEKAKEAFEKAKAANERWAQAVVKPKAEGGDPDFFNNLAAEPQTPGICENLPRPAPPLRAFLLSPGASNPADL